MRKIIGRLWFWFSSNSCWMFPGSTVLGLFSFWDFALYNRFINSFYDGKQKLQRQRGAELEVGFSKHAVIHGKTKTRSSVGLQSLSWNVGNRAEPSAWSQRQFICGRDARDHCQTVVTICRRSGLPLQVNSRIHVLLKSGVRIQEDPAETRLHSSGLGFSQLLQLLNSERKQGPD